MNVKEFINHIINYNNIYDILHKQKLLNNGLMFERIIDIIVKFGFIKNNSDYIHLSNKFNIIQNIDTYINEKAINDDILNEKIIAMKHKRDNTYIFMCFKYPKTPEDTKKKKTIKYYNIQNIVDVINDNFDNINYKIYFIVEHKYGILEKIIKANKTNNHIKDITNENIYDITDLDNYFLRFKNDIIMNKIKYWQPIYFKHKEKLKLHFHQKLIAAATTDLREKENKTFSWKCTNGVPYILCEYILSQYEIKGRVNILIITPMPTEVNPQFTHEFFNRFEEFESFKIHNLDCCKKLSPLEISHNNIFIIPKKIIQKFINDKTLATIKKLKLDIIVFDERYISNSLDKSNDIIDSYSYIYSSKIYLTFSKPLLSWKIPLDCQLCWTSEDVKICKSILIDNNLNKLDIYKEKYGNFCMNSVIKYFESMELYDIFNKYNKTPEMHLITNLFDRERYEEIKRNIKSPDEISFDILFQLDINNNFIHKEEIKKLIGYITGSNRVIDYRFGDISIFRRINNISRIPYTQIWFLPNDNTNLIAENLKTLMDDDNILKNFDIFCLKQSNDLAFDINSQILTKFNSAISNMKYGFIILANISMCSCIDINICGSVIIMNDLYSQNIINQQINKCMKISDITNERFIVDFNINRVINTILNYLTLDEINRIEDKIKYLLDNKLLYIDYNYLIENIHDNQTKIRKLINIWSNNQ